MQASQHQTSPRSDKKAGLTLLHRSHTPRCCWQYRNGHHLRSASRFHRRRSDSVREYPNRRHQGRLFFWPLCRRSSERSIQVIISCVQTNLRARVPTSAGSDTASSTDNLESDPASVPSVTGTNEDVLWRSSGSKPMPRGDFPLLKPTFRRRQHSRVFKPHSVCGVERLKLVA